MQLHFTSLEARGYLRRPYTGGPSTAIRAGEQKGSGSGRPVSTEERSKGSGEIRRKGPSGGGPDPQDDKSFNLEDFNPLSLGRRSRRIFDDVWTQFAKLSSPLGSQLDNELDSLRLAGSPPDDGSAQAATTRVLVVGATGRVGRVLIRKLVLRGYAVSALVRDASAHGLPQSVAIIEGNVNDYDSCRRAVQGVDKVVYCAGARSPMLVDEKNVSESGVQTVAAAFQDAKNQAANRGRPKAASFNTAKLMVAAKQMFTQWRVTGLNEESEDDSWGMSGQRQAVKKWARPARQRNSATAYINHRQSLVFEGSLPVRNAHATVGCDLQQPPGKPLLANCEGLTMRVASDGQPYWLELSTGAGHTYSTRFSAGSAFTNVRLPFNVFRPQRGAPPQWDPADASHISIRRDARPPDTVVGGSVETNSLEAGAFHLEVLRIKALPGGSESDFVLVSCAAAGKTHSSAAVEGVGAIKRAGEACLRRTGLGYTIVRPAELVEEPGGYKALLFDQGNRIRSSISCVDVADVCMRALHNPAARNKTFELAHETPAPLGMGSYELVAHLPDKSNDYLGPALSNMEKNL
ncbi:hypothetical protein WJX73_008161 [Symbiochloris irregularis]|uniref:NAD(P)-binding domain-containing protein n=1 Tax=Symbiochloris irregularis TaxID=706552 RepID=A0AAW1PPG1_9CHLO